MVGTLWSADLVVGLLLGSMIGLLAAPLLFVWLAWREWSTTSRDADRLASEEADLLAEMLERIDTDPHPPNGVGEDAPGDDGVGGRIVRRRWQARR